MSAHRHLPLMSRRGLLAAGAWACSFRPSAATPRSFRLAAVGDSLVSGYGIRQEEAVPARLERRLRDLGCHVQITNAGVSGQTSADIRARLPQYLTGSFDGVLIAAGANDLLQGLNPDLLAANLDASVRMADAAKVPVAIAGIHAPPVIEPRYAMAFNGVFQRLAADKRAPVFPSLLDNVALNPEMNLPDGVHPNAKGADYIASSLAPFIMGAFGLGAAGRA